MKNKMCKLRFQIFLYMTVGLLLWFITGSILAEILYYFEDKRGFEFPFKFYIILDFFQAVLLILINIPFFLFLIRHVDEPVRKIIKGLNLISTGTYNEKIDFNSGNELDEIKTAFNDMSEKLIEAEKIKQNAENERVLLFANMAHDLKTPITSIIGFSKALSDGIIDNEEKKKEYIATINLKAVKMNALIDRLFEYVKLESSENQLRKEDFDIAEILRNCIADIYAEYEDRLIDLELDIPDAAIIKNVDKVELSRVYTNLLNNVIKHNPTGIRVLVRMDCNGNAVIADSGACVPPDLEEKLFSPFVSGDVSRRSANGSGLGLSLAYKIMKKHGGNLKFVQNKNSVPSCYVKAFIVELP